MKYLLLVSVVLVLWWVWKKRTDQSADGVVPKERPPEKIVECAHCGVNHPLSESLTEGEANYCCAAHRQAGKSPKRP